MVNIAAKRNNTQAKWRCPNGESGPEEMHCSFGHIADDDYERERVDLQRHIGRLSTLVRSHVLSGEFENSSGTTNDKDDDHSIQLFLQSFEQAMKRLPQLSGFSHQPAHLDESWGTHWRSLRFHIYGILAMHDTEEETHVDILQQFLCLLTT
jgi:hypothetical protein